MGLGLEGGLQLSVSSGVFCIVSHLLLSGIFFVPRAAGSDRLASITETEKVKQTRQKQFGNCQSEVTPSCSSAQLIHVLWANCFHFLV